MTGGRIGVLGGTFNPIHRGHLHIARSVQSLFALTRVYFTVAATPPHKKPENLLPFAHRYAMVSLAVAREISFVPSMAELEPESSPYTIDTLAKIQRQEGDGELFFIAGGDSLLEVASWRESERLLDSYNFIFVRRPWDIPIDVEACLPESARGRVRNLTGLDHRQRRRSLASMAALATEAAGERRIYIVDVNAPDISSTKIRALCKGRGGDRALRRLTPPPVRDYLRKLHLLGEK